MPVYGISLSIDLQYLTNIVLFTRQIYDWAKRILSIRRLYNEISKQKELGSHFGDCDNIGSYHLPDGKSLWWNVIGTMDAFVI